jgi:hypothetical protein
MRNILFVSAAATICLLCLGRPGNAEIVDLHYHSPGNLLKECNKAGGQFRTHGDSEFSCGTNCKGGKGDSCLVDCSATQDTCSGVTPRRMPRGRANILQILGGRGHLSKTGGSKQPPAGARSFGGNARPKGHRYPVKIGIKPPKHYRHPVKIGTFKPPYAGNKADGNGHSVTIMRTSEHHWDERHK